MVFRSEGRPSVESLAFLGFLGGVGIWTSTSVVLLNSGASSWQDAGSFDLWQVAGLMVSGAVFGGLGYLLGKHWYPPPPIVPASSVPILDVAEGERAIWTGTARVTWPFLVLIPFAVAFLFLPGWLKFLALAYFLLAFLLSHVSVTVDDRGMTVRLGGVLTVKRIGLEEVGSARPIDLEPKDWGGWGYRMIPNGTAVVLRRGDGIEVTTTVNRKFGVTVDDAATGAALLNGLVARQASSG
jgi:hypothetical protein